MAQTEPITFSIAADLLHLVFSYSELAAAAAKSTRPIFHSRQLPLSLSLSLSLSLGERLNAKTVLSD